jgi:hypothetical protein
MLRWLMNAKHSVGSELAGKTEVSGEADPTDTLSTTNPTWPDLSSKPSSHGVTSATNRLSYGTAESAFETIKCNQAN